MSSMIRDVVLKLVADLVLPYVVHEASNYASRAAIRRTIPPTPVRLVPAVRRCSDGQIPSATEVTVLSAMPGRIRLHVTGVRGNPTRADALSTTLFSLPGVESANANPLTGNILICYNPRNVHQTHVLAAVQQNHLTTGVGCPRPSSNPRKLGSLRIVPT